LLVVAENLAGTPVPGQTSDTADDLQQGPTAGLGNFAVVYVFHRDVDREVWMLERIWNGNKKVFFKAPGELCSAQPDNRKDETTLPEFSEIAAYLKEEQALGEASGMGTMGTISYFGGDETSDALRAEGVELCLVSRPEAGTLRSFDDAPFWGSEMHGIQERFSRPDPVCKNCEALANKGHTCWFRRFPASECTPQFMQVVVQAAVDWWRATPFAWLERQHVLRINVPGFKWNFLQISVASGDITLLVSEHWKHVHQDDSPEWPELTFPHILRVSFYPRTYTPLSQLILYDRMGVSFPTNDKDEPLYPNFAVSVGENDWRRMPQRHLTRHELAFLPHALRAMEELAAGGTLRNHRYGGYESDATYFPFRRELDTTRSTACNANAPLAASGAHEHSTRNIDGDEANDTHTGLEIDVNSTKTTVEFPAFGSTPTAVPVSPSLLKAVGTIPNLEVAGTLPLEERELLYQTAAFKNAAQEACTAHRHEEAYNLMVFNKHPHTHLTNCPFFLLCPAFDSFALPSARLAALHSAK
jgi:hypothetical protein